MYVVFSELVIFEIASITGGVVAELAVGLRFLGSLRASESLGVASCLLELELL